MTHTPTRRASSLLLAHLAAHRYLPLGASARAALIDRFGDDRRDREREIILSTGMLAVALLTLRDAGEIALQPVTLQIVSFVSRRVDVRRMPRFHADSDTADAGDALLAAVRVQPHQTAFDVIARWLGRSHRHPRAHAIRRIAGEALRRDATVPDERALDATVERWRELERDQTLRECLFHDIDAAFRLRAKDR